MSEINIKQLILAREARGISQTNLARMINFSQGIISKIENEVSPPTMEYVERVSNATDFPISMFFQDEYPIYGLNTGFHRKNANASIRLLKKIQAIVNLHINRIRILLNSVDIPDFMNPYPTMHYDHHIPEIASKLIREQWKLPLGPVGNLTRVLEKAGIIVISEDFGSKNIDGFSINPDGLPPIIFVNAFFPGDRLRFTLAHELGHLMMHSAIPTMEMEKEANRFAGAFLMPKEVVREQLRELSLERLALLKPYWRVSMQALLYRAKDLRISSDRHRKQLWTQLTTLGYKEKEPEELDIPKESPGLLKEMIDAHLNVLGYSVPELAAVLHLHVHEFKREYFTTATKLRVVG